MSQETMEWLNKFVLVGFTEQRGDAWHRRAGSDNHFSGAVPVEEVRKRLFNWEPVKVTPEYDWKHVDADGKETSTRRVADSQAFVIRSDNGDLLGAHTDKFSIHGFDDWLLRNCECIMDGSLGDTLHIGQAGLLKNGAQAWVSFEFPETIEYKPKGAHGPAVGYRPQLIATTSLDGSIATTYKFVWTVVVCDNTRNAALSESAAQGDTYRVKHTRHSSLKIGDARQALDIAFKMDAVFKAELDVLMKTSVNSRQWDAFKELYVPIDDPDSKRGVTMANNKRDKLNELYETDDMVTPWAGTAYGVVQAVNTYDQWHSIVRKVGKVERNTENTLTGKNEDSDRNTWLTLQKVLATV